MKQIFSLLLCVVMFAVTTSSAQAIYFNSGESLTFPKTQKFNETVFVAGSDLTVDSDIVGDLVCAGQNIIINSKITGDILCAGQNITVNGSVDGNVRVVGQQININGNISRNLSVGSQSLRLGNGAQVKGDLYYGAQNVDLQGITGRDLAGGSETVLISGSLLRNAKIATNKIVVSDSAKLNGDLEYYIEKNGTASINEKSVKGVISRHEVVFQEKDRIQEDIKKATFAITAFDTIVSILSIYLLALFLMYFLPSRVTKVVAIIKSQPIKSALTGLAVLIVGPIAILLLCLTIVGSVVGIVLGLFYIISLIVACSFTVIRLSHFLEESYLPLKQRSYFAIFLSSLLLGVITNLPILGGIIGFILLLTGLGASFKSYFPEKKIN